MVKAIKIRKLVVKERTRAAQERSGRGSIGRGLGPGVDLNRLFMEMMNKCSTTMILRMIADTIV